MSVSVDQKPSLHISVVFHVDEKQLTNVNQVF